MGSESASASGLSLLLCFRKRFWGGVSTAAHQVEGGNLNHQWPAWGQQAGRTLATTHS